MDISHNKSSIWLFVACLVAPAAFDFLRKVIPGQPYFLLAAAYPTVLVAWCATLGRTYKGMPNGIRLPLLLWICFQLIYWALAIPRGLAFSSIAFFTHIVPILMAWVAYTAMISGDGLKPVYRIYGLLAFFLLPFGLMVAIKGGNEFLPSFLRAGEMMAWLDREKRAGFSAYAGIFNTQDVLSMTYMACAYVAMAYISIPGKKQIGVIFSWAILLASVLLIYCSTRRGAFYGMVPGLLFLIFLARSFKIKLLMIVGIILIIGVFKYVDSISFESGENVEGRLGLVTNVDFQQRFEAAFGDYWIGACKRYPFGTFLGSASREGTMYHLHDGTYIEIGAACVTKETGIFGVSLLLILFFSLVLFEFRLTRCLEKANRQFCRLLIMFQISFFALWFFKEMMATAGATFAHLLFWAVPGIIAGVVEQARIVNEVESFEPYEGYYDENTYIFQEE